MIIFIPAVGRHFLSSIRQVLIHSANEETAMEISGDDSKGQITETPTKLTLMGKVKAWQATMPEVRLLLRAFIVYD